MIIKTLKMWIAIFRTGWHDDEVLPILIAALLFPVALLVCFLCVCFNKETADNFIKNSFIE